LNFRDLSLKVAYDSEQDSILHDFYIPVLSHARKYYRLAGFFSSTVLSVAARGISAFLHNDGEFRLIVGAMLNKEDVKAIIEGLEEPEAVLERVLIEDIKGIEAQLNDHIRALSWLVASNRMKIKFALVINDSGEYLSIDEARSDGLFHQKVGIFEDSYGNVISFSGSINETADAWIQNVEEFKVFRSWIPGEKEHLRYDIDKFNKYWNNKSKKVITFDMPEAVRREFIKFSPENPNILILDVKKRAVVLRPYQQEAVQKWFDNGCRGILEMATGTGKTYTAIECMSKLFKRDKQLVTIICCPFTHLITQWSENLKKFDYSAVKIFGGVIDWKKRLSNLVFDYNNKIINNMIILTTHNTLSNEGFTSTISMINGNILLIGDEVHGLGSEKRRNGLLTSYRYRLGLSATPIRWFDDEGTKLILDYFNGVVFRYGLREAIEAGFLSPYDYIPYFIELTEEELLKYNELSRLIAIEYNKREKTSEELYKLFLIMRNNIIVNSIGKYSAFNEIINENPDLDHCLVYCSPQQIDEIQKILNEKGIVQHKFTAKENMKERKLLLEKFEDGVYQVLVAMRCLDEGVDIPSTKTAIFMASSTNPKEFIQRRGRILRVHEEKDKSVIYDIMVVPTLSGRVPPETFEMESSILKKELRRYFEFAKISLNPEFALSRIYEIASAYKIDLEEMLCHNGYL